MTSSKWCPSCGDEYQPRITHCLDCGVALVDHEPAVLDPVAAVSERDEVGIVEAPLQFDLTDMTSQRREELFAHLEAVPIPHLLVDQETLQAVPGYEAELADAVTGSVEDKRSKLRSAAPLEGRPISLWHRSASVMIDGLFAAAITLSIVRLVGDGGVAALVVLALLFANQAVGLGERGRSIGKALVGGRLRSTRGGPLTLGEAAVRWLLKDGLSIGAIAIEATISEPSGVWRGLEFLAALYFAGLIGSVLVDQQLRGLHDHLVDSAVVSSRSLPDRAT